MSLGTKAAYSARSGGNTATESNTTEHPDNVSDLKSESPVLGKFAYESGADQRVMTDRHTDGELSVMQISTQMIYLSHVVIPW